VKSTIGWPALLGNISANITGPGGGEMVLHADQIFVPTPWPAEPQGANAAWCVDDFTADNGPTEIIPGSHLWGEEQPPGASTPDSFRAGSVHEAPDAPGLEPVLMPAGSLMLGMGTLWHRGGANRSRASRLVITPQYCVAWGRQMESMLLAVPPEVVAGYPERVQQLLGYSIHPPFMGHVNGLHPARLLKQ